MSPQFGVLSIVFGLTAAALAAAALWYPRTIKEYWQRSCMGRAWKRTFPNASKGEIREFLYTFVDAFAFPRTRALQFAPTDRVLSVYRAVYPLKGFPDALELETFATQLDQHYSLSLREIWREELTLGEVFSHTSRRLA
jgi:propanediol dehydratase small subunit